MATKRVAVKESSVVVGRTTRTKVVKPFQAANDAPPAQISLEEAQVPFQAAVEGKKTSTKSRVKAAEATMPKGLDPEKAMRDAQAVAPPKPKRARKPKAASSQAAPAPGTMEAELMMSGLVQEFKDFVEENPDTVIPLPAEAVVEVVTAPAEPEPFKVLPGYEIVRAPFHTEAPYTIIVRKQGARQELTAKTLHEASSIAKEAHIITGRRTTVLRPGMEAIHFSDVEAFYEMRAAELRNSTAAGQERANREMAKRREELAEKVAQTQPARGRRYDDSYLYI